MYFGSNCVKWLGFGNFFKFNPSALPAPTHRGRTAWTFYGMVLFNGQRTVFVSSSSPCRFIFATRKTTQITYPSVFCRFSFYSVRTGCANKCMQFLYSRGNINGFFTAHYPTRGPIGRFLKSRGSSRVGPGGLTGRVRVGSEGF